MVWEEFIFHLDQLEEIIFKLLIRQVLQSPHCEGSDVFIRKIAVQQSQSHLNTHREKS